jgi:hypothetical protein
MEMSEIGGWWYDPETSAIKDVQGRTVGAAIDADRGVKMAAAEELVRGMRQVEIIARDERLDASTRAFLILTYAQNLNKQLQRDMIASLPTATGRNS